MKPVKTLLIQIRNNKEVEREEYESFLHYSGLKKEEMDTLNAFHEVAIPTEVIDNYDALFIGGTSSASVLEPEKFPFINSLVKIIKRAEQRSIPTFASCFGFQLAVIAFEGVITHDEIDFEQGTVPISLTKEAKKDILLCDMPNNFMAVSVHQQKAITTPDNCTLLAYTKACCHILKVKNKPFWAFQFHPEVDKKTLIERLAVYAEKYTEDMNHYNKIISNAKETVDSNSLVKKFVDRVLKG